MNNTKLKIPNKPTVPTILIFALVFWGACALTYSQAPIFMNNTELSLPQVSLEIDLKIVLIALISICCICGLCLIISHKINLIILSVLAISLGVTLSLLGASIQQTKNQQATELPPDTYKLYIIEDSRIGNYNTSVNAELFDQYNRKFKVKLQYQDCDFEILAGYHITAECKLSKPSDSQTSNYWQNGISATAKATNIKQDSITNTLTPIFTYRNHLIDTIRKTDIFKNEYYSEAEQLISAIICGQRIDLNSGDVYTWFKNAGLAHLVAVSGAHLSLVTGLLIVLLKRLKVKRWIALTCQSIFILLFLICAAIPISALRAAFMVYTALFAYFGKRRSAPLNGLGLCIIMLITINPQTAVSVSFALSAGSTIGIILFGNLLNYYILKGWSKTPEFVSGALSMTFAANICTLPLSISIFSQIPLLAPISNIICAPLFTVLCGFGLISSVLSSLIIGVFPKLAEFIMIGPYIIAWIMVRIVNFIANLPYATIEASIHILLAIVITVTVSGILILSWPQKKTTPQFITQTHDVSIKSERKGILSAKIALPKTKKRKRYIKSTITIAILIISSFFIASFIKIPSIEGTQIVVLDVGQGDSILLKSSGKNYLIDTGNQDSMLQDRLNEQGIDHLDGLFITHPDDDHCGSIDQLQKTTRVDSFYCAKDMTTCTATNCSKVIANAKQLVGTNNIKALKVDDKINFGEIELKVIWPDNYSDEGGNADSLTMICTVDINNDKQIDATALLCGDAEKSEIEAMQNKNRINHVDIYKVGHHGSKNAITEKSFTTIDPKISIFSVGAKNKYGHPASSTIDILESNKSQIFRTDQNGSISCIIKQGAINIKTSK